MMKKCTDSRKRAEKSADKGKHNWKFVSKLTIEVDAKWDFPTRQTQESDEAVPVK